MGSVRVAIVGVGNCATSLIQGVEYYRNADPAGNVPGLMHVTFGDYPVSDVEFVAAFDVDAKKVGFDLSEATSASENNTIKIADVPTLGIEVQRGPTLDGLGKYYRMTIEESGAEPVDVERRDELHVGDVVLAEGHVHETRDRSGRVGVLVVVHALDQGGGAVANSHDCYSYRTHRDPFLGNELLV